MTSRLKHKLEIENVNVNSAYINESFVQIGTPLPALSGTKKDKLEYVPEWQQEVRDEQGRRRFHGAFTGGFSAGYYNSVGSKEGWTPSTFKSSRANRATKVQRPEDFMDEEDLQQMNEDRRLENTETFQNEGFAGMREESAAKGAGAALDSLIAPARTSIGTTLLQKLGWRPGQGIGPRVTLRKLRRQEQKLGLRKATGTDEDEEMDDVEAEKHTFAPRDTRLVVYEGKDDRAGLGFEKGRGMGALPRQAALPSGLLAGNNDEDDDPYAASSSNLGRGFAFGGEEEEDDVIVMGGPSRPARPRQPDGPSRSEDIDRGRWHDGRPVLAGFALDPLSAPTDKWFEFPEIPPDWRPRPARVWGTVRKWDEAPGEKKEEKEAVRGAPGRPLTFEQRGEALGEEKRVSKAKSVFEFMSEKDRERLASLAASAKAATAPPPPLSTAPMPDEDETPASSRPTEVVIPPLSPRTASSALKGFLPYPDDLPRQERYVSYLTSQTYNTKTPYPQLRAGTVDDINKELEDFASSARIFKPMSFAMSSRFTSGSSALAASDLKQAKPGLHIFDAEKAEAEMAAPKGEVTVEKVLTPREQAAKNGMYGKMTREVRDWYPVKLLCRRFGVPDPHPEGAPRGVDADKGSSGAAADVSLPQNDASWTSRFKHQGIVPAEKAEAPAAEGGVEEERVPRNLGEVGMGEDVNQGREILTYTKPSIDIFKAIFASDDEDDDDGDEPAKGTNGALVNNGVDAVPSIAVANAGLIRQEAVRERVADPFPVKEDAPVDLATFKPVFTIRPDRGSEEKTKEKRKEKKEKKKRKGVLSFDVGEEEGGMDDEEENERRRKKKKEREGRDREKDGGGGRREDDRQGVGEGEWVEKPATQAPAVRASGRMGAADFM